MAMNVINSFLEEINQTLSLQSDQKISQLTRVLSIIPSNNAYISKINTTTNGIEFKAIATVYDDDWPAFNNVVCSFLKLCDEIDPLSLLKSFDLYTAYLNDLSIAFNNNKYGWLLSNIVRESSDLIIQWAVKLDLQLYYHEQGGRYRLNYLASVLLKMFNHIRSQINDINSYKRSLILYLGNKLCLIYFKIDNPLLCRNIFSNMNNTNLHLSDFTLMEQLQYRYYLSKFYLIKYQLLDSFFHLSWCLTNSLAKSTKNTNMILELLIPISLALGKIPNFKYIRQICNETWLNFYDVLSQQIKSGDVSLFDEAIEQNYQYLKDKNVLLLMNKVRLVITRNLVKNIWKILGKPNNLDYDSIKAAVRRIDDDYLVENILISLIDQNLLKGKIFTRLRKVALSKNDPFPPVYDIYNLKFPSKKGVEWM